MVELVRVDAFDDRDVVHDLRQMRQHFGQFRPAFAVPGKPKPRPQHGGIRLDKSVTLPVDHRGRDRLALQLLEQRLAVEQLQLARRPAMNR